MFIFRSTSISVVPIRDDLGGYSDAEHEVDSEKDE
jgi:hypothetical protein